MTPKRGFVIMSFNSEYDAVYSNAIRPAMEFFGIRCERADSPTGARNIPAEIVRSIIDADLVIADLSEPNPNVYYELGISHCTGDKTVAITSNLKNLPFDIATWRAIEYQNNTGSLDVLRLRLVEAIRHHVAESAALAATNLVQEAGRNFFNMRRRVEQTLETLSGTIERIGDFAKFTATDRRVDNSLVAEQVTEDILTTLVGRRKTLVSITGPGAVGKSTFSQEIAKRLSERSVTAQVLPTDAYMKSRADRIIEGVVGFDIAANDVETMSRDITSLLNNQAVEVTPYDHRTGSHGARVTISSAQVLILEGIHSFYPGIHRGPHVPWLKYYIYAAPNHARELKFLADFTERRYDIQTAYEHSQSEYAGYEEHVLPYIRHADRIIEVDRYWRYVARPIE